MHCAVNSIVKTTATLDPTLNDMSPQSYTFKLVEDSVHVIVS